MNTQLSLDTCNNLCAVALSRLDEGAFHLIASDTQDLGRGHAEVLADQIQQILSDTDIPPTELSRIAVTTGPGSFTGQRVGLALARTLSATLNVEAVGVGVLDTLIFEAQVQMPGLATYCAISDAKRDGVYIKAIENDGSVALEANLIAVSDISKQLARLKAPFAITGSGAAFVDKDMFAATCRHIDVLFPSIQSIAQIGHGLNAADNPAAPLYLRDADAKPQSPKHVLRMPASSPSGVAI